MFLVLLSLSFGAVADCNAPNDKECLNMVVLNVAYDEQNPTLRALSQPAADNDEFVRRMNTVGKEMWDAGKDGTVSASASRTILFFGWDIKPSLSEVSSYHRELNGQQGVAVKDDTTSVIEIVDPKTVTLPSFEGGMNPGTPSVIYRITIKGFDQSIQMPWANIGDNPLALLCQEDYNGVYPPGGEKGKSNKKGFWKSSEVFGAFKTGHIPIGFVAFISR